VIPMVPGFFKPQVVSGGFLDTFTRSGTLNGSTSDSGQSWLVYSGSGSCNGSVLSRPTNDATIGNVAGIPGLGVSSQLSMDFYIDSVYSAGTDHDQIQCNIDDGESNAARIGFGVTASHSSGGQIQIAVYHRSSNWSSSPTSVISLQGGEYRMLATSTGTVTTATLYSLPSLSVILTLSSPESTLITATPDQINYAHTGLDYTRTPFFRINRIQATAA
jgi:hypothetical protein